MITTCNFYCFSNILGVQYELVSTSKICSGGREDKGRIGTVEECAKQCTNVASMFIYAKCDSADCRCYCETGASADGTCDRTDNSQYRLYRFIQEGIIHFTLFTSWMGARDGRTYYVSLLFLESQELSSPNLLLRSANGQLSRWSFIIHSTNPGCFLQVLLIHGSNLAARGFMLVIISYSELAAGM